MILQNLPKFAILLKLIVTNMKDQMISSKKATLQSDYKFFDLLPLKKFHQCSVLIPETIILQKGYIKQWLFNSRKISNHPILKKKKENLTPFSVAKSFCIKAGYKQQIQGCSSLQSLKQTVQAHMKEQKDYDFIKCKKTIQITTTMDQVLVLSLSDFLEYANQNKYNQQCFFQRWKIIQQKVSFTKIDEFYKVQNVRNNHIIESKSQKIISLNTTEVMQSTQLEEDPYKNSSPKKNFDFAETKNIEGYKFFDTFLNKKFFNMSQELIDFIQKNLKCLVECVTTKFVINKEREPYLAGIQNLQIKPVKKIADMRQFISLREKGSLKIEDYLKFLQTYTRENNEKNQHFDMNQPIKQRRTKCRGKMCRIQLQDIPLPHLLQQKLKIASSNTITRVVGSDLKQAVIKRKKKVIDKFIEHHLIDQDYEDEQDSSQYQSEGQKDQSGLVKLKVKQIRVCQKCFQFYFHVNRFFDLDMYGNLIEKRFNQPITDLTIQKDQRIHSSEKNLSFLTKQDIKRVRQNKPLLNNRNNLIQTKTQQQIDIKPVTSENKRKIGSIQKKLIPSQPLSPLNPLKRAHSFSPNSRLTRLSQSKKQIIYNDKTKLNPIAESKKSIIQRSLLQTNKNSKGSRLMTLTKMPQLSKLSQKQRNKSKTMLQLRQNKAENIKQAGKQILSKLSNLPRSSKQQFIYYAKRYFKDNLPQPIQRVSYSSYYEPHLYEFMNTSPVSINNKRRIKKRPQMSLKRLSELTEYPQIVSRSEFIFDTIIVNQQTTIPFCVITSDVVNPQNITKNKPYQNIFIINDIFDCFIEHISLSKQLLQQDQITNKRIILFNYPGQSHTIYNRNNKSAYTAIFSQILDKLIYRLSKQKGELGIIDFNKDYFKFCGFGLGGFLLTNYLSSYSGTFQGRIANVLLVNTFLTFPQRYRTILSSLFQLYSSQDPTIQEQAHLYYNKIINSQENTQEQMQHKSGLNPIRVQDRLYIIQCINNQILENQTKNNQFQNQYFQEFDARVTVIYAKLNTVVGKQSSSEFVFEKKNSGKQIQNRVLIQIEGGHDIFADNYEDIFRVLTIFCRK